MNKSMPIGFEDRFHSPKDGRVGNKLADCSSRRKRSVESLPTPAVDWLTADVDPQNSFLEFRL